MQIAIKWPLDSGNQISIAIQKIFPAVVPVGVVGLRTSLFRLSTRESMVKVLNKP